MDNALNYTTSTVRYTVIVDTTPPKPVTGLTAPLNNLTTNQMTISFQWTAVSSTSDISGLADYILEVSTDPAFGIINYSAWVATTTASLTLITSSYSWRVNTMDNALNYTTSTAHYFITVDTTPPPQVSTLNAPLDNLTTNQMTLNFSWGSIAAPPSGLKNYILEVSTDPAFGVINYSSWVVLNSARLTLTQSSYTWRVNAMDNALNYTTSTVQYFVTVDTTAPPAVSMLSTPADNSVSNQLTQNFNWTGVTDSPAGIANYILEVSTSSSFVPVRYSSWVVLNQASLTLVQSSYTWRVNTVDNALNYTTSTAVYFVTVDTTPPPAVSTLSAPLNNLTTNQMTLNFNWTGVTDSPAGLAN
jgi:phage anti-repressor protein